MLFSICGGLDITLCDLIYSAENVASKLKNVGWIVHTKGDYYDDLIGMYENPMHHSKGVFFIGDVSFELMKTSTPDATIRVIEKIKEAHTEMVQQLDDLYKRNSIVFKAIESGRG